MRVQLSCALIVDRYVMGYGGMIEDIEDDDDDEPSDAVTHVITAQQYLDTVLTKSLDPPALTCDVSLWSRCSRPVGNGTKLLIVL